MIMALTGFGQMPIYKRYYMSDIPGFGWLADFYMTRNIHYIGAAVLLTLVFYAGMDFLLSRRKRSRLAAAGYLRLLILAAIVFSGALIVIKNFPYVHFPDTAVIGLDLAHLAAAITLLIANLVCLLSNKRWTVPISTQ
jgi:cbb3-type cytochrome oxidase subunit 3